MISILLATYNGEKYIKDSINSIIKQDYKDWELLIGFNGTNDSSKNIVSEIKDDRIKVFDYKEEKGKAKTLNKLIKESKYDLCAIQDDDDIWFEKKLSEQINYFDRFDVIGTFIKYIDSSNQAIGEPNLSISHQDIKSRSLSGEPNSKL